VSVDADNGQQKGVSSSAAVVYNVGGDKGRDDFLATVVLIVGSHTVHDQAEGILADLDQYAGFLRQYQ
jgi:hypothetical protein